MSDSKLISIIVPAYNIEKYIGRCLDSILGQTYTNLEIIVVDDGSTDNTGRIVDEYATKDDRIKVIHQENAGLSGARNSALLLAQGDYIGYVDGDDYITPDMYRKMLIACEENNAEIAVCGYNRIEDESNIVIESTVDENGEDIYVLSQEKAIEIYLSDCEKYHIYNSVWSKLFRRDIISRFNFPTGKNSEDIIYTTRAFCNISKCVFVNSPLYYYVADREGSLMNVRLADRRFNHELPFWEEQAEVLTAHNFENLSNMSRYYYYRRLLSYYEDFRNRKMNEDAGKLYRKMKDARQSIIYIMEMPFGNSGDRMRMKLFLFCPGLYFLFSKLYSKILVPIKNLGR